MRTRILAAFAVLAALASAGCSNVVDGTGSEAAASQGFPSGSTDPSVSTDPTTSPAPTPADFTCPNITSADAHMTFDCISDAMTVRITSSVFSITMAQSVEATGWQMEMGAQLYRGTATSFVAISSGIRGDQLRSGAYGTSPTYKLDAVGYSTISGRRAYTTIDTVTLNPTWAKSRRTAVKQEKRWLVIVELSPGRYTTWFASIPDISRPYWARVPTSIASIRINA